MEFNPKKFQERESDVMSNPEKSSSEKKLRLPIKLNIFRSNCLKKYHLINFSHLEGNPLNNECE